MSLHGPTVRDQIDVEQYRREWREGVKTDATADNPCPICGKPKFCYFDARPAGTRVVCRTHESDEPHPRLVDNGLAEGWFHAIDPTKAPTPRPKAPPRSAEDVSALNALYVAELAAGGPRALSDDQPIDEAMDVRIEVPVGSYREALEGLGFTLDPKDARSTYSSPRALTIPEYDGTGRQIGIMRRFVSPDAAAAKKMAVQGTARGLTIPRGFATRAGALGTVYVVEGESDVVAMTAAGLCAIGQPGAGVGDAYLAEYLSAHALGARVVVVQESDAAGESGAPRTAAALIERGVSAAAVRIPETSFGRPKDVRQYLTSFDLSGTPWPARGAVLEAAIAAAAGAPPAEPTPPLGPKVGPDGNVVTAKPARELVVTSLADVQLEAVEWLVEGRIPLKAVTMIFAPGGSGKSTLVRSLVADVSRGRCALGETYDDPIKGGALIMSAEDDLSSVSAPGLFAAGADTAAPIHFVRAATVAGATRREKAITIKDDVEVIDAHLAEHPSIRIVVIDPITSYVGAVDDWKASELKPVLDPLKEMAERRNVAVILVGHANKNQKVGQIIDRLAGAKAYSDTCRMNYVVCPDPEDDDQRVMRECKCNLIGVLRTAVVFRQVEPSAQVIDRVRALPNIANANAKAKAQILGALRVLEYLEPRYIADDQLLVYKKTADPKMQAGVDTIKEMIGTRREVLVTEIDEVLEQMGIGRDKREKVRGALKADGYEMYRQDGNAGPYLMGLPQLPASRGGVVDTVPFNPMAGIA